MDEVFDKIKSAGKNDVDNLTGWMKSAKLSDSSDDQLKTLFSNVPNPKDISLDTFKEILTKFATDQKKPIEEFIQKLIGAAPEMLKSFATGAMGKLTSAFC